MFICFRCHHCHRRNPHTWPWGAPSLTVKCRTCDHQVIIFASDIPAVFNWLLGPEPTTFCTFTSFLRSNYEFLQEHRSSVEQRRYRFFDQR